MNEREFLLSLGWEQRFVFKRDEFFVSPGGDKHIAIEQPGGWTIEQSAVTGNYGNRDKDGVHTGIFVYLDEGVTVDDLKAVLQLMMAHNGTTDLQLEGALDAGLDYDDRVNENADVPRSCERTLMR